MDIDPKKIASQYKYCFKCGGEFEWQGGKLLICQTCKLKYHIAPVPCNATILTNDRGEILLIERGIEPKKGCWDLPGGFLDLKENIEESVSRELKEELGIDVGDIKYFCSTSDLYTYEGIDYPTIGSVFVGKIGDQKVKASDDAAGFKFFNKDEIPYDRISFDGIKKSIKKFATGK